MDQTQKLLPDYINTSKTKTLLVKPTTYDNVEVNREESQDYPVLTYQKVSHSSNKSPPPKVTN